MYFNMLNSDGHWTREQNQFLGIHGTLISGTSAWRETDWHQTTNAMQLNWNGVWWKCKKSTIFQSTIVLQKLGSSGATQFNFSLNGNEANSGNVFRTFGTGTINNTISDFKAIGISLDADPAFFNSHVEIY